MIRPARNLLFVSLALVLVTLLFVLCQPPPRPVPLLPTATTIIVPTSTPTAIPTATPEPTSVIAATDVVR